MGVSRIVNTDFWHDEKVIDFSPEDKYFMLYLLTNPQSKQVGIYKLPKKIIAFDTGYNEETIKSLLARFQNDYGLIYYSEETQEVAILNYLKHSIVKGGKPVLDCIEKDLKQVKNKKLIHMVYRHVLDFGDNRPILESVKNIFLLFIKEINDNDNDNDNDRFVDVSLTSRGRVVTTKEEKLIYGEFQNVKLTPEQYEKLTEKFPYDYQDRIEDLSIYMDSKGKTYKSHYATILNWSRMEEKGKRSSNPFKEVYLQEVENEQKRNSLLNGDNQNSLPRILPPVE